MRKKMAMGYHGAYDLCVYMDKFWSSIAAHNICTNKKQVGKQKSG